MFNTYTSKSFCPRVQGTEIYTSSLSDTSHQLETCPSECQFPGTFILLAMRAPEAIEAIQTLQGIEFPRTFEVVIYKGNKEKCPHFQISMSYPLVFLNMLHSSPLFSQHYTCSDDHIYELFQRMGSIVLTDYQCQE